jgi:hypothetical protein
MDIGEKVKPTNCPNVNHFFSGSDEERLVDERTHVGCGTDIKATGGTRAEGGCTSSEEQTEDSKDREEMHTAN